MLEYDATHFSPDVSISTYIRNLIDCTHLNFTDNSTKMRELRKRENLDPQIDEYLGYQDELPRSYEEWELKLKDFNFVIEGCRSWQERAVYQQRCINSGDFLRILVYGLRNLNRLKSVRVCQEWDIWPDHPFNLQQAHHYNSPFGRTWHIFRAPPRFWGYVGTPADGFDDFWVFITALALSQTRLRCLDIGSLPFTVFDTVEHATESMIECSIDVFSGLEDLCLTLYHDTPRGEARSKLDKLSGLQSLLRSTTGLKVLNLCLPEKNIDVESYFTLDQVLPTSEVHWTELCSLELCNVSTSARDLIQFLTIRTSKLQEVHFLNIELIEGSWEGVIESMQKSMHLRQTTITGCRLSRISFQWSHCMYQDYVEWKGPLKPLHQVGEVCNDDVEEYVLRGGRNPFLHADEPDSASEKYLSAPWL